jgi:AcrR family transcriptional regulator
LLKNAQEFEVVESLQHQGDVSGSRDVELSGPGRPRDPSTEHRVFAAAKEELAERGIEAFSIRSVARRSGVSRPSLLLRWPDRNALILDTLERLVEWPSPEPRATVRAEIDAIVERVGQLMEHDMLAIQLRLIADAPRHPNLFAAYQDKVMSKAGKRLTRLLERAVSEGQLPADADVRWAADVLIGVIFMRTIRSPGQRPPSSAGLRQIVDVMWTSLTSSTN